MGDQLSTCTTCGEGFLAEDSKSADLNFAKTSVVQVDLPNLLGKSRRQQPRQELSDSKIKLSPMKNLAAGLNADPPVQSRGSLQQQQDKEMVLCRHPVSTLPPIPAADADQGPRGKVFPGGSAIAAAARRAPLSPPEIQVEFGPPISSAASSSASSSASLSGTGPSPPLSMRSKDSASQRSRWSDMETVSSLPVDLEVKAPLALQALKEPVEEDVVTRCSSASQHGEPAAAFSESAVQEGGDVDDEASFEVIPDPMNGDVAHEHPSFQAVPPRMDSSSSRSNISESSVTSVPSSGSDIPAPPIPAPPVVQTASVPKAFPEVPPLDLQELPMLDDDIDVAHSDVEDSRKIERFNGRWTHLSAPDPIMCEVIADGTLFWFDGYESKLHLVSPSEFFVELRGDIFHARLVDGHLQWDDGDIWAQNYVFDDEAFPVQPAMTAVQEEDEEEEADEEEKTGATTAIGSTSTALPYRPGVSAQTSGSSAPFRSGRRAAGGADMTGTLSSGDEGQATERKSRFRRRLKKIFLKRGKE